MGDADAFAALAWSSSPKAMTPCLSSSLIAPVALRRDASRLTSSSKKKRPAASIPRFGMNLRLRLARHLCGIIIPQIIAATTRAGSGASGMRIEFGWNEVDGGGPNSRRYR